MDSPSPDYKEGSPAPADRDFRDSPPPPPPGRSRSPVSSRDSRSPRRDRSKSRSKSPVRTDSSGATLYFASLSTVTTEAEIERRCSKYGKVMECNLVRDPRTKESRGFGFVVMDTSENATLVIDNMHETEIDGLKITVEKARRNRPRSPTPGKYLGSDRYRRPPTSSSGSSSSRPPQPYGAYGSYSRSGSRYPPPPTYAPPYGYGYGYPYPPASYGRPSYPVYPPARYPERYQPYRRERSPPRSSGRERERDRYSPPSSSYRREPRERSPYYSRDRSRSRSRERHYI